MVINTQISVDYNRFMHIISTIINSNIIYTRIIKNVLKEYVEYISKPKKHRNKMALATK